MVEAIVVAATLAIGVLIGCVGIGGVLLVPALAYIGGVPIHTAIAAAMFGYLFSGTAATIIYARKGSIDWSASVWLWAGAMPAAFAGALAVAYVGARFLEALIALLVLFAGIRAFRARRDTKATRNLSNPELTGLGAFVGFGSAMTGTGGPLILVPLLVWLRQPILTTIGLSQAIQLPIAALATVGNVLSGTLDLALGALLSGALLAGSAAGAWLAHAVPTIFLTRFVGILMLFVGAFIVARLSGLAV